MAGTLRLEIVTPTGRALDLAAADVRLPSVMGEMDVLPEHRPGLIKLTGGFVRWGGAQPGEILIRGGIAEVRPDGLLILADQAIKPADADRAAALVILEKVAEGLGGVEFIDDDRLARLTGDRAYAEAVLSL